MNGFDYGIGEIRGDRVGIREIVEMGEMREEIGEIEKLGKRGHYWAVIF